MNEQLLQYFFKKSPVAFSYHEVILDDKGFPYDCKFLDVSNAFENVIGLKASEVIGKIYSELFPSVDDYADTWRKGYQKAVINNKTVVIDVYNQFILKWIRITVFTLDKCYFACIFTDVTKEYMQEKQIEGFLKANIDMLCVVNVEGNFIKVNKEFEKVLGYKVEEIEGKNLLYLLHEDDVPVTLEALKDLEEHEPIEGLINRYRCRDGSYRYLEWYAELNGKHIYASARDVTEKQDMQEKLNEGLIVDELTGLLNKHFFNKRVLEEMERSDRYNEALSMIILSVDNYKNVNDTWGHSAGNEVLKQNVKIVSNVIRKYDILVRLGGDEFALLMPKTNLNGAMVVAEKIRKALNSNIHPIAGQFTVSLGVVERMRVESFDNWYKRLEGALLRAKEDGQNCIVSDNYQGNLEVASVHLQWKSEWESGNKDIDEQHKALLELANELIYMSLTGLEFEKIICQLDIFIKHIVKHFDYEDKILEGLGYPDYDRHSKIHKNLVGKAFQLKEAYRNGEINSSAFFTFIVDDIIIGHITDEDMLYLPYIRKKSMF